VTGGSGGCDDTSTESTREAETREAPGPRVRGPLCMGSRRAGADRGKPGATPAAGGPTASPRRACGRPLAPAGATLRVDSAAPGAVVAGESRVTDEPGGPDRYPFRVTATTLARFWAKVDKAGPVPAHRPALGPCWLWTACTTRQGYGQFRLDGRIRQAHVAAWELEGAALPAGAELDHLCRVRRCVRKSHLDPVPHRVNVQRGAHSLPTLGRCFSGRHVIESEADLVVQGGRTHGCRHCWRETNSARCKRYRQRH
jgi:hypothetical protein